MKELCEFAHIKDDPLRYENMHFLQRKLMISDQSKNDLLEKKRRKRYLSLFNWLKIPEPLIVHCYYWAAKLPENTSINSIAKKLKYSQSNRKSFQWTLLITENHHQAKRCTLWVL